MVDDTPREFVLHLSYERHRTIYENCDQALLGVEK